MDFGEYLNQIDLALKSKDFDKAWELANKGLIDNHVEYRFMFYYQMALIRAREKNWKHALLMMGFMIYFFNKKWGGPIGGISHRKFILRLLKKFQKEDKYDEYLNLAMKNKPQSQEIYLNALLGEK